MADHIATLPRHRDATTSRRGRDLRRVGIVALSLEADGTFSVFTRSGEQDEEHQPRRGAQTT